MQLSMEDSSMEKKIYYHDTDCGGVVYYANYLKYLEEARTEFFSERGVELKELVRSGIGFVVARVEIDYKSPAKYQDILKIITRIEKTRASVIQFFQKVLNHGITVVEARTTLVCVGADLKPLPMPEQLRKHLTMHTGKLDSPAWSQNQRSTTT